MTEPKRHAHIDYKTQIFYNLFQRIAREQNQSEPEFNRYWVVSIDPKQSQILMSVIKKEFHYTGDVLKHLKRFLKTRDENENIILKVIICPIEDITEKDLNLLLCKVLSIEFLKLESIDIPMNKPFDKKLNIEWSNKYWPLVWKGNPLVQILNENFKQFDKLKVIQYMKKIVAKSIELSNSSETIPVVTVFVDPVKDKIMSIKVDERSRKSPVRHSIICCIDEIAQSEKTLRSSKPITDKSANNYLCLNYHVYTTHEPCTMCAMALVHSRISRLVYLKDSKNTGAISKDSGKGYMIHISCSLNWKYESFKMLQIEGGENIADLDPFLNV